MAIVSIEYYTNVYMGEAIATEDFPRYENRAENMVLLFIKKTADKVEALPQPILDSVKNAICAQMEYLYEEGITVASTGQEESFTVGKVSVKSGSSDKGMAAMMAPAIYMYLEQTGLLNPSVETFPQPMRYSLWL